MMEIPPTFSLGFPVVPPLKRKRGRPPRGKGRALEDLIALSVADARFLTAEALQGYRPSALAKQVADEVLFSVEETLQVSSASEEEIRELASDPAAVAWILWQRELQLRANPHLLEVIHAFTLARLWHRALQGDVPAYRVLWKVFGNTYRDLVAPANTSGGEDLSRLSDEELEQLIRDSGKEPCDSNEQGRIGPGE